MGQQTSGQEEWHSIREAAGRTHYAIPFVPRRRSERSFGRPDWERVALVPGFGEGVKAGFDTSHRGSGDSPGDFPPNH
jgi:hypothetical protein